MTTETDEELYLRLKRWGKMSSRDIQKEVLLAKYQAYHWSIHDIVNEALEELGCKDGDAEEEVLSAIDGDWPYYEGKKITRVAERACPNCGDSKRTPCRFTQYLETCVGCGNRIGDTPKGI